MEPALQTAREVLRLPPLILHPFSDANSPQKLVQSSRASLMLQGLLPNDDFSVDELEHVIIDGRFCEIRMLYYVGKDVLRWIEQCVEVAECAPDTEEYRVRPQSFAVMLIEDAPSRLMEKLSQWGVQDYRAIFSRAIGLNAVFAGAPEFHHLSSEFVRNYHHYVDQMYACWRDSVAWRRLDVRSFSFELYASGEYSRLLEREWSAE